MFERITVLFESKQPVCTSVMSFPFLPYLNNAISEFEVSNKSRGENYSIYFWLLNLDLFIHPVSISSGFLRLSCKRMEIMSITIGAKPTLRSQELRGLK